MPRLPLGMLERGLLSNHQDGNGPGLDQNLSALAQEPVTK